jgi:hypothetical protein
MRTADAMLGAPMLKSSCGRTGMTMPKPMASISLVTKTKISGLRPLAAMGPTTLRVEDNVSL